MNEPDEFDLELQMAGAVLEPGTIRALEAARSLDPARAELAALRGYWTQHRPPLALPPPRPRRFTFGLSALAAVVAVLLALVLWPSGPGFQARGAPAVDVWRIRDGAPVEATRPVVAGDELGLALVVDTVRYLSVASLQEDGTVTPLVLGRRVEAGSRFAVPGRISLDAYPGREWLVVWSTADPPDEATLRATVGGLLPRPATSPDRFVVEVTRGQSLR